MSDSIPTFYTESGRAPQDDGHLVSVRLPADVADELMIVTLWLSLQIDHRIPVGALRRALVLGGVANAGGVLASLRVVLAADTR